MPDQDGANNGDNQEYESLLLLEDMESLLEDLEEAGITGLDGPAPVPDDLRGRMEHLGVRDVQQLRDRIMHLHARIDEDERDLEITES